MTAKSNKSTAPAREAATGRFLGVTILDPAVRPKNTTVKVIREAVKLALQKSPAPV